MIKADPEGFFKTTVSNILFLINSDMASLGPTKKLSAPAPLVWGRGLVQERVRVTGRDREAVRGSEMPG